MSDHDDNTDVIAHLLHGLIMIFPFITTIFTRLKRNAITDERHDDHRMRILRSGLPIQSAPINSPIDEHEQAIIRINVTRILALDEDERDAEITSMFAVAQDIDKMFSVFRRMIAVSRLRAQDDDDLQSASIWSSLYSSTFVRECFDHCKVFGINSLSDVHASKHVRVVVNVISLAFAFGFDVLPEETNMIVYALHHNFMFEELVMQCSSLAVPLIILLFLLNKPCVFGWILISFLIMMIFSLMFLMCVIHPRSDLPVPSYRIALYSIEHTYASEAIESTTTLDISGKTRFHVSFAPNVGFELTDNIGVVVPQLWILVPFVIVLLVALAKTSLF